jgi:hypothetical protein
MTTDQKEYALNYHQAQIHLLKEEWEKAASIIAHYVRVLADNPNKFNIPVEKNIIPMLQSMPPIPSIESFTYLIEMVVTLLNNNNLEKPLYKLN